MRAWYLMAKSGFWGKKGRFERAHLLTEGIVFDGQLIALGPALCQQVLNAGQLLLQDLVLLLQGQQRGHGPCRMGWRKMGWDLGWDPELDPAQGTARPPFPTMSCSVPLGNRLSPAWVQNLDKGSSRIGIFP